jgi:serine phosphatase RsbU (regulator of sigma subunit)/anti-sigma regulatory factor (Ser/Thr protein kinase)
MVPSPIQTSPGKSLDISFSYDYADVRNAMESMVEFLKQHSLSEDEIMGCELAVAEGCNNAIRYSDETAAESRVRLHVHCSRSEVQFWVHDHTVGFEWPETVELPPEDSESGRGLYLMTSLMDDVHYFRGRRQNILYLSKMRGAPAVPAELADPESADELRRRLTESDHIITDMAEELSFCYESLAAIFRHIADQGKGTTKAEFSRRLLNDLIQIISADWYVLRLLPEHGNSLNFVVASESLFTEAPIPLDDGTSKELFRPIEQEAVQSRQNVWFDRSRPLDGRDPLGRVKPGSSGVVHPFFFGDRLMGTLVLGRNLSRVPFTAGQLNVVGTFSDFLAIQFVNSEIQESLISSRLTERELEIARNIQRSLLLQQLPVVPGMELVTHCVSARQVGGDFFDVLQYGDDEVLLVIADVMGKGVPAATFAAILRSLIRALPRRGRSPAQLLYHANQLLYTELSSVDMFITAQLVLVNHRERTAVVGSAGHCPAMITSGDGSRLMSLTPDGLPLGILPGADYEDESVAVEPGARLIVYTDGIPETRGPKGDQFDFWRLGEWLQESARNGRHPESMKSDIIEKLARFQGDDVLQDDLTFLLLAG